PGPRGSTDRASKGSWSASMDARPRRPGMAAIVDLLAPGMPVIMTALIGAYRRPARKTAQTSFVAPAPSVAQFAALHARRISTVGSGFATQFAGPIGTSAPGGLASLISNYPALVPRGC